MVVNNTVLKRVIKECCRSLSFDVEERQFSFPLYPCLALKWNELKGYIHGYYPDFYLSDFNHLLSNLDDLIHQYNSNIVECISDSSLLNGEVLEIKIDDDTVPVRLVKMKDGQYLHYETGRGISLGRNFVFKVGHKILTSEGRSLGKIRLITLLLPSNEHIVISRIYIGNYYRNRISCSLWPLYEKIMEDGIKRLELQPELYLSMSKDLGIQSFTLLNILNAAVHQWR